MPPRTDLERCVHTASGLLLTALLACGGESQEAAQAPAPSAPPPAASPSVPAEPASLPRGLALSLAQFVEKDGQSVPGPARAEFLYREGGAWHTTAVEDPDSNVFHKFMTYGEGAEARLLSLSGSAAHVKSWRLEQDQLVGRSEWTADFGGKFSRMRDAEIGDLYGDGAAAIAVATHDQGVVAALRPQPDGSFAVTELDREANTFVHEVELGDLDGDGALEIYATPSEPNRLDGTPQSGHVVRYVPAKGEGRVIVADLGARHAKEILVDDVDGDGRDELYVSVEGVTDANQTLLEAVEIRRYDADTEPAAGVVIATLDDSLCRFLSAGDIEGDGKKELVAAAYSSGVWLLRPGADPRAAWQVEGVDADSAGFEHASILTDLDGDGRDELYVASDQHKEVRRYVWNGHRLVRSTIYVRPDDRPVFTWNLMPVPVELIPGREGAAH